MAKTSNDIRDLINPTDEHEQPEANIVHAYEFGGTGRIIACGDLVKAVHDPGNHVLLVVDVSGRDVNCFDYDRGDCEWRPCGELVILDHIDDKYWDIYADSENHDSAWVDRDFRVARIHWDDSYRTPDAIDVVIESDLLGYVDTVRFVPVMYQRAAEPTDEPVAREAAKRAAIFDAIFAPATA